MKLYKPISFKNFKKLVESKGFKIRPTTKHYEIVDSKNNKLMNFAVSHSQGRKREVLPCYIVQFLSSIN